MESCEMAISAPRAAASALEELSLQIDEPDDPEALLQSVVCELAELNDEDDYLSATIVFGLLTLKGGLESAAAESSPCILALSLIAQLINPAEDAGPPISNSGLHDIGMSSLPLCATELSTTVCLLLCTVALQRVDAISFQKRTRRWKSMQIETLLAYYRNGKFEESLFLDYILPSTTHIQWLGGSETSHDRMLFEAFSIKIMTELLVRNPNLEPLLSPIDAILGGRSLDLVWQYRWRIHYADRIVQGTNRSHAELVNCARGEMDRWDFLADWSERGVAILMARLWEARPRVWVPSYQWHVFFPYVDSLLLSSDAVDDDESDEEDIGKKQNHHICVFELGFSLLHGLLDQTPIQSVTFSSANARNESIPDNPMRSMQLVANHVVVASRNPIQSSPSAQQTYEVLKKLLQVYPPWLQIELVELLVDRCPFPGLQPKLVDLLRGYSAWKDPYAVHQVLDYCDRKSLLILLEEDSPPENINLEYHMAMIALIEVAPAQHRNEYRDRLVCIQKRINGSTRLSTDPLYESNGWVMLGLALERMLE